jgi:uncharacterized delta-60 repeat protein
MARTKSLGRGPVRGLVALLGPLCVFTLVAASPSAPPPGTLDPRFSGDGYLVEDFANHGWGMAVALQRDGRIVTSGQENTVDSQARDVAVVRYLSDGQHDPSFGGDGIVFTDLAGGPADFARDVAVQRDGKIVAGGSGGPGLDLAIVRYLTDGALDLGFGSGGYVLSNATGNDVVRGVAIQRDGKIVGGGFAYPGPNFVVARWNTDGTLDPTFGNSGVVVTDLGGPDQARGIALQTDGKIVVGGYAAYNFAVARYLPDGTLDPSWDADGKAITDLGMDDVCRAVAIQPDGKVICGGYTGIGGGLGSGEQQEGLVGDFAMVRYLPDGSLDQTFGVEGMVITDIGSYAHARTVVVQADGKIILAGHRAEPVTGVEGGNGGPPGDFAIARYLPDGSLDPSFGVFGVAVSNLGGDDGIRDAVIQSRDGKVVVVGISGGNPNPGFQFAVARYVGR